MTTIGLDIGGSHVSVGRVEWTGKEATIVDFGESDVDTSRSVAEIINDWIALIRKSVGIGQGLQVGIAMPGPFDYPNGISLIKDQGKMKALFGLSVKNLLADGLNIDPNRIVFTNDAEAFLLGESLAGAGRGFENSIGLTLGTGLGSAFNVGGEVWDAKLWTAPFRDGKAEDYLGTGWIRSYVWEKYQKEISGMRELVLGEIDSEIAADVFWEYGTALGEFLYPYLVEKRIHGLVLGGKISRASNFFLPHCRAYLDSLRLGLEIRISKLGERAAMLGACMPFFTRF
ncbi:ROK family protein [Algoriphagus aestuariicola]|uniref:ROK family protein n=1 Tax=Algoriphagus aestuariicola TaxID=1852016 RepID=A0ABS3BQ24_9BACT|nr:ROK family protein [Algoriphagus aestuariicola]MBN7801356.1 ROK family protein [Algoriphagus aestuariicola]